MIRHTQALVRMSIFFFFISTLSVLLSLAIFLVRQWASFPDSSYRKRTMRRKKENKLPAPLAKNDLQAMQPFPVKPKPSPLGPRSLRHWAQTTPVYPFALLHLLPVEPYCHFHSVGGPYEHGAPAGQQSVLCS